MATNAEMVERARKMGLTGYDKQTASVTGPGAAGTERNGTKRRNDHDAAGNYTGPVNDFGLTQRTVRPSGDAADTVNGMTGGQRASLDRQLAQLGVTLDGTGGTGNTGGGTGSRSGRSTSGGAGTYHSHLDAEPLRENVRAAARAALAQQQAGIDEATRRAVRQLQQTRQQAQAGFQTQRDAAARDEAQALDNSALYAELRGDRGGIGRAQYDSIQNAAAASRQSIRQAQAQLDTDTSRQVAELCAQGEYEKANAVLEAAQQQLTQLQDIEKLAIEYDLNVDKLNNALAQQERQWNEEQARTAVEDARYADERDYKRGQTALDREGQLAEAMLKNGMPLTQSQRQALGITEEQEAMLANFYAAQAAEKASKGSGRSGRGGGAKSSGSSGDGNGLFAAALEWAEKYDGDPEDYVRSHYKQYGFSNQSMALSGLAMYQTEQAYAARQPKMTQEDLAGIEAYRTPEFWEKLAGGMQSDWNVYEPAGEEPVSREQHARNDYDSALALARRYGVEEMARPYLEKAVSNYYKG